MDIQKTVLKGYMLKSAAGGAVAAAAAASGKNPLTDLWRTGVDTAKAGTDMITKIVNMVVNAGSKAAPYVLAAPPLAGLAGGYVASQMTAPTGEDMQEAQKHLEEQALLQFQSDLERTRKARALLREKILPKQREEAQKAREIAL